MSVRGSTPILPPDTGVMPGRWLGAVACLAMALVDWELCAAGPRRGLHQSAEAGERLLEDVHRAGRVEDAVGDDAGHDDETRQADAFTDFHLLASCSLIRRRRGVGRAWRRPAAPRALHALDVGDELALSHFVAEGGHRHGA